MRHASDVRGASSVRVPSGGCEVPMKKAYGVDMQLARRRIIVDWGARLLAPSQDSWFGLEICDESQLCV